MHLFGHLIFLLTFTISLKAETSTKDALEEIRDRHAKIESYFAVYEGEAPGGKSLGAAISYHGSGKMASVQAQFLINGKVVADTMQAITPELGIVINGQDALHLTDAPIILGKLAEVVALLFGDNEAPLGIWSPALSMTRDTMAAQLSITSEPALPWTREGLPEGTTHRVEGDLTVFTTLEGSSFHVQSSTGILQSQSFPNEKGDRTLVLKDLQIGLSEAEISEFIHGYVPPHLQEQSMRGHSLLAHIQRRMLTELVAFVDDGSLSHEEVVTHLSKAKPALQGYFAVVYPPEFWAEVIEKATFTKTTPEEQIAHLQKAVIAQQETDGLKPERVPAKTDDGQAVAELLASTLESEFLAFIANKSASLKEE